MRQTGIFEGRVEVRYPYGRFGWTRNGGKTWHGGLDLIGLDDKTIRMPYYTAGPTHKKITGTVTRARIVFDHGSKTWEWGWYVCVKLDANQTPDNVNFLYFCHCSRLLVAPGQKVSSGDALAIMGQTGNAAGGYDHCHCEARATSTGTGVNPIAYTGTDNAVGVYGTNTESNSGAAVEDPAGKKLQCIMIGPLDAAGAAKCDALARQLDLVGTGRYYSLPASSNELVKAIGALTNGDAVKFYALAEAEGWAKDNKYVAQYVG